MILVLFILHNKCNEFHFFLDSVTLSWGLSLPACVSLPLSDAGASVGFKSRRVTRCGAQHSPLGCRRISHMLNPISFGVKLKDELTLSHSKFKSDLHSVRWNQRNPPSNFEMRPSRPRGLSVARCGLTALGDISRDLSPSVCVYLSVDCSTSLSPYLSFTLSLSLNIEDSFISGNPHFFFS